MHSAEACKALETFFSVILCAILLFCTVRHGKENGAPHPSMSHAPIEFKTSSEDTALNLYFNDTEIPVIWEKNDTVDELFAETANGDIVVAMSMYGGNEQVGSLGKRYTSADRQITTHNGDIVLYSSNQIVVFYGSNSWAYTMLGKINLPEDAVTELLSKGDISLTLKR